MSYKNRILTATPLMCLFAYLLMGFVWGLWHPGWLVFLLIPVMPYLVGKRKIRFTIPLLIIIMYLILGFAWKLWHPGWIIFLLIPIFEILFGGKKKHFESKSKDSDDYIEVE